MRQGNGSDLLGVNDPRNTTIGVIYVTSTDEHKSVLAAILTQEKLGRKQIVVVLPSEQNNKAFQLPVNFDDLKTMRRKLQSLLVFIIPYQSHLATLARQRRFPVYSSLENYVHALRDEELVLTEHPGKELRGLLGSSSFKTTSPPDAVAEQPANVVVEELVKNQHNGVRNPLPPIGKPGMKCRYHSDKECCIYNELGQLIELHLCHLQLTQIPPEVWQCSSLETLYLNNNQLSMLPAELGQLTTLQTLDLSFNRLSMLPAELGQLITLQTLLLQNNQLSTLPAELGLLTALQQLDLYNNPLQAPLPDIIKQGIPATLAYLRTLPPIKIFYCYAHQDRDLRDRIDKHLAGLKRRGHIVVWYDREIQPGRVWEHEVEKHLSTAGIILLLVSADFLDSDYCYSKEMQKALKMHDQGKVCVIPILLRPVDWHEAPFAKLQILPSGAKPITRWPDPEEALEDVARQIRAVVTTLRTYKG